MAHTLISATMLILFVFGRGGVAVERCLCSGKTSLVLLYNEGCCARGSQCMQVSIVQGVDDGVASATHMPPAPMPTAIVAQPLALCATAFSTFGHPQVGHDMNAPPPPHAERRAVLRV